ncbi:MAG: VCBS repeat-containing protein [Lewinellaceae bacterium]|nr:VCBS repeat-containing protein [Lewinellaceae bacterium]
MKIRVLLLLTPFLLNPLFAQQPQVEICDNQIDDDGDGYVDCYDIDCPCDSLPPCSIDGLPTPFRARMAWQSTVNSASLAATPAVANMNPQEDDMPEIIVAQAMSVSPLMPGFSNRILFFRGDGSNAANPIALTIQGTVFYNRPVPGPTIGDIDRDGKPELLIACNDRRIRVYRDYTESNPANPMTLWITSADLLDYQMQRPFLADFDGDGTPEVYAGNDVFRFDLSNPAAPTLTKINNPLPIMGRTNFLNYGTPSCNPTAADLLSVADCNGDPDCAGLELAAGPVIYSVDLDPNDGDGYEIKIQRSLQPTAQINYTDGYTAVADVDLDGVLDVIVAGTRTGEKGIYIWNKNGIMQFFPYPTNTTLSGAIPCIANVFDDRTQGFAVDLPEILIGTTSDFCAYNLQAAQLNPAAPYWWNIQGGGNSGYSPATTFDFNGDGIEEIVFRGTSLRIVYGGPAPFPPGVDANRNWFTMVTQTVIADESPIVADVDNDGEAEILVMAVVGNIQITDMGRLRVLESDAGPWVPCRKVWNQYNYFAVNVNDDLTIPTEQQLHHLELPPGSGEHPLNRFHNQIPAMGGKIPAADASAQAGTAFCQNNQIQFQLEICNTGSKTLQPGTPIAFYSSDPASTNAVLAAPLVLTNAEIAPDSCLLIDISLPGVAGLVYGVVNDDGSLPRPFNLATDFPATDVPECNWLNNIFEVDLSAQVPALNLGADIATCADTALLLSAGAGHLSYQWQDGSSGSTFQASGPGLFWVEVTDQCLGARRDSILVEAFGLPQIQIDTVNGDCFGNQPTATVLANSQYPPLSYNWSTTDTGPVLNGVATGMYTVTVTDAKGCTRVDSTWIETGGLLQAGFSTTAIPCAGQTGSININIAAGTPPFDFAWSVGGSTGNNLQNLPAGMYTVTVTDGDDCAQVLQIELTEPAALLSAGFTTAGACPGAPNGSAVFLGATQGTPPYSFVWSTSSQQDTLKNIPAGNYSLTLTDANGCTLVDNVVVPELEPPVLDTVVRSISCFGANDGSIEVQLSGGLPGFAFSWSNFMTTPSIQNLSSGDYVLILEYADGQCSQFFIFHIDEPQALQSAGVNATPACPGEATGTAVLSGISQGTAPYKYLWSDGNTDADRTGLVAGAYSVVVTDANGCSLTELVQITEFDAPVLDSVITPASCAGLADGSIALSLTGGTPGFDYLWSTGQTTPDLQQLSAGFYSLDLHFANGQCLLHYDFQIGEPQALLSNGISSTTACPGTANGSASFLGAAQGTPPYSLQWSTNDTTPDLTGIPGGFYTLTVTDALGCTLEETVQVPEFSAPVLDPAQQDISCFGAADGSIAANPIAGSPGFSFAWSDGIGMPAGNTAQIQNLGPGPYTLTLGFANGACAQTYTFQITEPLPLLSNGIDTKEACTGSANGSVNFLGAAQGTAPYSLLWSDNSTQPLLTGLAAGMYTLTITDANGCTRTDTTTVADFDLPMLDTAVQQILCAGAGNGQINIVQTGGGAVSGYQWSTGISSASLDNLGPGTYTLTVNYGDGQCAFDYVFQLSEPPALDLTQAQITPVRCFGEASGSITVLPAGGVLPYQFFWAGAQTTASLSNLPAGNYALTLSDANGCTALASYSLPQPEPLSIVPTIQADTCGKSTGAIAVSLGGGTMPYELLWSTGTSMPGIFNLAAGQYNLALTDAQGCTGASTVQVPAWDSVPVLMPFAEAITCAHPVALLGVSTDQQAVSYAWTGPGGALPGLPQHSVSMAGNYTVTVSNSFGCSATAQVTVPADLAVPLAEAGPAQLTVPCDASSALLDASSSSVGPGFTPHWYRFENGAPVFDTVALVISVTTPGLYVFSNTDQSNGCVARDTVLVAFNAAVVGAVEFGAISCFGAKDGVIFFAMPSGGTAPYMYSIDGQTFGSKTIFDGLAAGIYPVAVRDALGCQWNSTVNLDEPEFLSVNLTATADSIDLGKAVGLVAQPVPSGVVLSAIQWEPPGFGIVPGALYQQVRPEATTEYVVVITDERGCSATDRVQVAVVSYAVYVPTAIAPDAPGNDRFTLFAGSGIRQVLLLRVYDRWGELMFENRNFAPNDPASGWDGSYRSKALQPGVYVWYAELEGVDGRVLQLSGDVTVLR